MKKDVLLKQPVTLDAVRKIGLTFPGVEASTTFGAFALKAGGKMFACVPTHKTAEPGSLLLRVDLERRAEMLEADPDAYYITPHYQDYPSVLVRLAHVTPDMVRDLLGMAHGYALRNPAPKRTPRKSK